ncbi:hypothetical protein RHGRI_028223 [Rhododendron griersonianum]|uniref:Uncharacterized protein n=1 Tax=Rhododendron griersonianum TaxID=479676 RepID=A0AAV6IF05_9ERIC|nr:hypothetical protein RHGRI_028223 [Rhododendron griersonianum]
MCRGHILHALSDRLYDFYKETKTATEIWNALEFKYKVQEEGTNKFLIAEYFDFRMIDTKPILDQIHELQTVVNNISSMNIILPEAFQVGAIIAKLPSSWKAYRKKLLHKAEDFSLEQIQKHLRIEEESRNRDKKGENSFRTDVHNIESGSGSNRPNNKRKRNNKKKNDKCYNCGKKGHYAKDCRSKKQKTSANMVEEQLVAMVTEINMADTSSGWWFDSGATVHVCKDRSLFKTYEKLDGQEAQMGNQDCAKVAGKGSAELNFTSGKTLTLLNVLHVPDMRKNLVSVDLVCKKGFRVVFESDKLILTKNGMFVGKGYGCNGMFKLSINENNTASSYIVDSFSLWHSRLAHLNFRSIKNMSRFGLINYHDNVCDKCEICAKAKMAKKSFPSVQRNSEILDLIHSDICELNGVLTRGGKRYFATFVDDFSKYTFVYLLRTKDEVFNKFQAYKNEVENQLNKKIKVLRSDRGMEYFPHEFDDFCEMHGIIHQKTAPYSPQQNGLAERKNRTLTEMANCMIVHANAPLYLWGEALYTACYLHNRIISRKTNLCPYELWKGRKPNLSYLKVWGCLAYYRVPDPKRTKLGPRAMKSIFVGYAEHSKAYRLLDLESNTIVESRNVKFFEHKFRADSKSVVTENSGSSLNQEVEPQNGVKRHVLNEEPRRSTRQRKEKGLDPDHISSQSIIFLVEGDREGVTNKIPMVLQIEADPKTFTEAISSRDAAFWKEAINDEMDSLLSNGTWKLVDLPPGSKSIGCKWVFRRKYNTDNSVHTFKARLVAKGFRQKEGIDYFDTYAPVARITSIRILMALASIYHLQIHQMDVKTAFLNGDIDEEVYMDQPEGFVLPGNERKVCKLTKSLYGLKQAPKQWHQKFDSCILAFGFTHNSADKCIYSKFTKNYGVIVCLYVDDMLIIGTNMVGILETKKYLASSFKMKDLGEVDTILGIKVRRHNGGFALCQEHYIDKMLLKFKHLGLKDFNTPFDSSIKLTENSGRAIAQLEYASAIGTLMYLMHCTRPDIAFAVCKLSRYTSNPSREHWKVVVRVFGYLKKTIGLGLFYHSFPAALEGYTDASWITSQGDNKSTSGWVFLLGGGAISWASKKQTCISHSTMESEFIALAAAGKEAEWIRNLLLDIKLWPNPMPPISIHCDSEATLSRAYSSTYNGKSRHISLRHDFVRQLIRDGVITIIYVRSSKNLADPFTKALSRELVWSTTREMGLKLFQKIIDNGNPTQN